MNKILLLTVILIPVALVFSQQAPDGGVAETIRRAISPGGTSVMARYSPAIEYRDRLLFVSGQVPLVDGVVPSYAIDGKDDIQDQAKIVMGNIDDILKEAGYSFNDALKVSVFLKNLEDYAAFNEIYAAYWPSSVKPPAREAFQVAALPGSKPGAPVLVEVSLTAGK